MIRLRGIHKSYWMGANRLHVLKGIDLDFGAGELVSIMGASGSGKSTLMNILGLLDRFDEGSYHLDGESMAGLSEARAAQLRSLHIGFVFQSFHLVPFKTAAENVALPLFYQGIARRERNRRAEEYLDKVGLTERAGHLPRELSGGQQQRVALARALIVEPETLLLDEPLSNLDANLREEMRFEIRRLHDEYRYTTVYVTHDQSEAMTTADLIAVMNGGRIDQLGTPEDIYARPESEFVARFIGASNVIKGTARDANHVSFAGATLKVVGAPLSAGQSAVVAIRQHDIGLTTKAPASPENALRAVVTRQVYLGLARDYMVEIADGSTLRVVTPTETNVAKGSEVWLTLPPDRCRALSR